MWPGYALSTASYVCSLLDPWLVERTRPARRTASRTTVRIPTRSRRCSTDGRCCWARTREQRARDRAFDPRDVDGFACLRRAHRSFRTRALRYVLRRRAAIRALRCADAALLRGSAAESGGALRRDAGAAGRARQRRPDRHLSRSARCGNGVRSRASSRRALARRRKARGHSCAAAWARFRRRCAARLGRTARRSFRMRPSAQMLLDANGAGDCGVVASAKCASSRAGRALERASAHDISRSARCGGSRCRVRGESEGVAEHRRVAESESRARRAAGLHVPAGNERAAAPSRHDSRCAVHRLSAEGLCRCARARRKRRAADRMLSCRLRRIRRSRRPANTSSRSSRSTFRTIAPTAGRQPGARRRPTRSSRSWRVTRRIFPARSNTVRSWPRPT